MESAELTFSEKRKSVTIILDSGRHTFTSKTEFMAILPQFVTEQKLSLSVSMDFARRVMEMESAKLPDNDPWEELLGFGYMGIIVLKSHGYKVKRRKKK